MRAAAQSLFAFAILFGMATGALAEKRVALVIGIDHYDNVPALEKATGDADAMGSKLRTLGFDVAVTLDPDRRALIQALSDLKTRAKDADLVFIHFSGHGVDLDGENYILPRDVPKPGIDKLLLESEAISQSQVLRLLQPEAGQRRGVVMVLDACRDNPYANATRSVGGERGLARVEPPRGVFILYSAGFGETALDRLGPGDTEPTSVYTRVLLGQLSKPGANLIDIANDTRAQVETLAASVDHQQEPAFYDQLDGRKIVLAKAEPVPAPEPLAPAPDPRTTEAGQVWIRLESSTDQAAIVAFQTRYAGTFYADVLAPQRLKQLAAAAPPPASQFEAVRQFGSAIDTAAISPDGLTLLSGEIVPVSEVGILKLWDVTTGEVLQTLKGHKRSVSSIVFSPDGRTALSGSEDYTLKLWDLATGKSVRTFKGHDNAVFCVALSPDGLNALSGSEDTTVKLWDVATGKLLKTFKGHEGAVNAVAFSPDRQTALSGSADNTMKLWDIATGKLLRTFQRHTDYVNAVAFSPDGRSALSGSADHTVKLWDLATGTLLRTFEGHTMGVKSVFFSPDGGAALSAGFDGSARLWEVATGKLLRTFEGPTNGAYFIAISRDWQTALSENDSDPMTLWRLVAKPAPAIAGKN